VPLFDDESVPLLGSGEVTAAGAGEVVGVADVDGAEVPLPLLHPARSTIKPLATIMQPLWNLMVATTAQRVPRCATVMLLGPFRAGRCVTGGGVCVRCELVTVVPAFRACRSGGVGSRQARSMD